MENSHSKNDPLDHLTLLELFALAERIRRPTSDIDDLCEKVTFIVDLLNTDRAPSEPFEEIFILTSGEHHSDHHLDYANKPVSSPPSLEITQQRLNDQERLLKDRETAITKRESDIEARERAATTKQEALATRGAEILCRETLRNVELAEGEVGMWEWFDSDDGSDEDIPPASEIEEEESSFLLRSLAGSLQTSTRVSSISAVYEFFSSDDESDGITTPPDLRLVTSKHHSSIIRTVPGDISTARKSHFDLMWVDSFGHDFILLLVEA